MNLSKNDIEVLNKILYLLVNSKNTNQGIIYSKLDLTDKENLLRLKLILINNGVARQHKFYNNIYEHDVIFPTNKTKLALENNLFKKLHKENFKKIPIEIKNFKTNKYILTVAIITTIIALVALILQILNPK